jgi:hypothetical protein
MDITKRCSSCGSDLLWVPTYCNHGHCAVCFDALSAEHDDCGWYGVEHASYGPASSLPGNVWIEGDDTKEAPSY